VVTHQLQVERRTGKVRRPETDVLPLCHATNYIDYSALEVFLNDMRYINPRFTYLLTYSTDPLFQSNSLTVAVM